MSAKSKEPKEAKRKRAAKIVRGLKKKYPHAATTLDFDTPFELLVATVLAAQSTDKKVNEVTQTLFRRYRTPQDFVRVKAGTLERIVRPTGFFRNKTKSIKALSKQLIENHAGRVPERMDDLVKLTGVGRKTANVVLAGAFGKPGVVVDTHMIRVSRRLLLSEEKDPVKIEFDLMEILPKKVWGDFSFMIVLLGREICKAGTPLCHICPIERYCPSSRLKSRRAGDARV